MKKGLVKKAVLIFAGLFLRAGFSFAQPWGLLTPAEAALSSLPEDSAADAVILFDEQEVQVSGGADLIIRRHTRFKIFTEKGKRLADVKLPFWASDKLLNLEAQTIEPDGRRVAVGKPEIFDESWQGWKRKVFAFPAVQVGSVLEYRYEIVRENAPLLEPWFFQNEEYTRRSQLTIEVPQKFEYDMAVTRFPGLTPEFSETVSTSFLGKPKKILTWKLENVPAIKLEPYVPYPGDYLSCVRFQLFAGTWGEVGEGFRKWLDRFLKEDPEIRKLAGGLAPADGGDSLRAKLIYDHVRTQIETADFGSLVAKRSPAATERERKGTATEKNLLLASLLKAAGLDAHPVLISTRGNGELQTLWPHPLQFNHLIVACPIGGRPFLLDAQNRYCPFGVLPPQDLVKEGLGIHRDWAALVKVKPEIPASVRSAVTEADLDTSGGLFCRTRLRFEGYQAVEARRELAEKKDEEYLRRWFDRGFSGSILDSVEIMERDKPDFPLEVRLVYRLPNFVAAGGEKVYLIVPWFFRQASNPFVAEKRILPVELQYPFLSEEEVTVNVPDPYRFLETPADFHLEHGLAQFSARYRVREGSLNARRELTLGKISFPTEEYAGIRDLFERQVGFEQTPIVLER